MAKIEYVDISNLGNIKNIRLKKKLSKESVAKFCGVSVQAYHGWENGITKKIREENYEKLSEVLNLK